jgi:pilus assembly protein CpaF
VERAQKLDELAERLRLRLVEQAHRPGAPAGPGDGVRELVEHEAAALSREDREQLVARISRRALGLGPLEELMRDPSIDEILVSGTQPVWVERAGRLERTTLAFEDETALRHTIERLLAPAGRRADDSAPVCDARLPDGSRVNVVLPPVSADGPSVTIRRFRPRGFSPDELVRLGSWTPVLLELLRTAVGERRNVLVCGATGSGKTTTLAALAAFLPAGERVVTVEDTAELRLPGEHVVRLEARPAGYDGRGEVTIRALVRNALRMRPDRLVVGEARGAEALDMLAAMATGHAGSMSTIHAGSPSEALRRLETLALMAGSGLPHEAIRAQVAGAIDLVVHQARLPDGSRAVTRVAQVGCASELLEIYSLRDGRPVVRPSIAARQAR